MTCSRDVCFLLALGSKVNLSNICWDPSAPFWTHRSYLGHEAPRQSLEIERESTKVGTRILFLPFVSPAVSPGFHNPFQA